MERNHQEYSIRRFNCEHSIHLPMKFCVANFVVSHCHHPWLVVHNYDTCLDCSDAEAILFGEQASIRLKDFGFDAP